MSARRHGVALASGALALAALLGGCAFEDAPGPPSTPMGEPTPAVRTPPAGHSAIKDLTHRSCVQDDSGRWTLTGTLTNRGDTGATYTVRVSIVRSAGSSVVASTAVTRELEAGESEAITVVQESTGHEKKLTCVPSVTVVR